VKVLLASLASLLAGSRPRFVLLLVASAAAAEAAMDIVVYFSGFVGAFCQTYWMLSCEL
jgi:hypothetical protein